MTIATVATSQAQTQSDTDEVRPGNFFFPEGPGGATGRAISSVDNTPVIEPPALPEDTTFFAEPTVLGIPLQAHITKRAVTLFDHQGHDVTLPLENITTFLRRIFRPLGTVVVQGELEVRTGEGRMDRSSVVLKLRNTTKALKGAIFHVSNVLYALNIPKGAALPPTDLHRSPYSVRKSILESLDWSTSTTGNVTARLTPAIQIHGVTSVKRVAEQLLKDPHIRGVIFKEINSPASLTGSNKRWHSLTKEFRFNGKVTNIIETEKTRVAVVSIPTGDIFSDIGKVTVSDQIQINDVITIDARTFGLSRGETSRLLLLRGTFSAKTDQPATQLKNIFQTASMLGIVDTIPKNSRLGVELALRHDDLSRAFEAQTVILAKKEFANVAAARKWAREHNFKTTKVDTSENSFRFRQFEPRECRVGSFRTKELRDGVNIVVCDRKRDNDNDNDDENVAEEAVGPFGGERAFEAQSIILNKKKFKTREEVRKWLRDNEFKLDKISESPNTFRVEQFDSRQCRVGSFRTKEPDRNVFVVLCDRSRDGISGVENRDNEGSVTRETETSRFILLEQVWVKGDSEVNTRWHLLFGETGSLKRFEFGDSPINRDSGRVILADMNADLKWIRTEGLIEPMSQFNSTQEFSTITRIDEGDVIVSGDGASFEIRAKGRLFNGNFELIPTLTSDEFSFNKIVRES